VRARAKAAAPAVAPAFVVAMPVRERGLRIAVAASVALALGAAGAAAALRRSVPHASEPTPLLGPRAAAPAHSSAPDRAAPPTVAPERLSIAKPSRAARSAAAQESYAAEVDLLQRAQGAYAERDLLGALVLVAAHGRRFPNGRLAEEGEALRVRSLAASGRGDEARSALAGFARRFPRSVLLPRLQETANRAE
jgi:hypothetical protein